MNTLHERLTHSTFSLPLGEVHALVGGAVNARPLLFLHGFPDHPPTAVPFLEHLAETPASSRHGCAATPPHRRPRLGRRYHPHRVRRCDLALIDRLWHAWSPSFTLDSARRAQERGLHHVGAGRFALALEARTVERGRNSSAVYNVSKLSPGISLGPLEPV